MWMSLQSTKSARSFSLDRKKDDDARPGTMHNSGRGGELGRRESVISALKGTKMLDGNVVVEL